MRYVEGSYQAQQAALAHCARLIAVQEMDRTTPPSTRSAAPVVAEA